MNSQNTSAVADVVVVAANTLANDLEAQNAARQSFMREFFHTARTGKGSEKLDDSGLFSLKDLTFFRGLYGGYTRRDGSAAEGFLTKKTKGFPLGVQGEVEKFQSDRAICKERGYDLDEKDLRRYLYVLGHFQKLQAVIGELDRAILRRKIEMMEKRSAETKPAPVQQAQRHGQSAWVKDRVVTKLEALKLAQISEEKLADSLKDSKIHSSKVLCIYSDKERLSFEACGNSIRYIIEKRS